MLQKLLGTISGAGKNLLLVISQVFKALLYTPLSNSQLKQYLKQTLKKFHLYRFDYNNNAISFTYL